MANTDQQTDQYARLRAWYLATLRSNAIDDLLGLQGKSLTPATLINADSQLIQKLIEEEPSTQTHSTKNAPNNDATMVVSLTAIFVICALALPFVL